LRFRIDPGARRIRRDEPYIVCNIRVQQPTPRLLLASRRNCFPQVLPDLNRN
jgi:hypothetical protein